MKKKSIVNTINCSITIIVCIYLSICTHYSNKACMFNANGVLTTRFIEAISKW